MMFHYEEFVIDRILDGFNLHDRKLFETVAFLINKKYYVFDKMLQIQNLICFEHMKYSWEVNSFNLQGCLITLDRQIRDFPVIVSLGVILNKNKTRFLWRG